MEEAPVKRRRGRPRKEEASQPSSGFELDATIKAFWDRVLKNGEKFCLPICSSKSKPEGSEGQPEKCSNQPQESEGKPVGSVA